MFSQRVVQSSMRRLATANPSIMSKSLRMASPASIAMGQIRQAATSPASAGNTTTVSVDEGNSILAAQRRNRPVSPHLSIYRPQITWYASSLNRITGAVLSGGFYIFGFGYLVAPYVGLHWESASIAAAFAGLPIAVKMFTKLFLAWNFTFHSFNGLRFLTWDTGSAMTNKQVILTGWTLVGVSVVTALGLTFY